MPPDKDQATAIDNTHRQNLAKLGHVIYEKTTQADRQTQWQCRATDRCGSDFDVEVIVLV